MATTVTEKPPGVDFDPRAEIKSGPALQRWRRKVKISRPVYAVLSDCSERTLATLESKNRLSMEKQRKLNEARRLIVGLAEIMEPENIVPWLKKPNEWFDGRTPLEAMDEGKVDKIWELIFHTKAGGYL
jgi:hypothetical protein